MARMMFLREAAALMNSLLSVSIGDRANALRDIRIIDGWQNAPFGKSKTSVAQNARAAKKYRAQRRARKLGHA